MRKKIFIRCFQIFEILKEFGLRYLLKELVFLNREAVPVLKDLSDLKYVPNERVEPYITFDEISGDRLKSLNLKFSLKSRQYKMLMRLDKGYTMFIMTKDGEIIGDVWGTSPDISGKGRYHSDLKKLGITLEEKDVYMFDMYLKPAARGFSNANLLMISAMNSLKNKGVRRVYGYYMANNYPALWVHRMLKFKELNRVKIHRFFFFEKSEKMALSNL